MPVWSIIPEYIVLGKMSGEHYLPNRVTAYGPVAEISASVQNYELQIVHNCLDMAVTSLMYHCQYINKFVLLLQKSAVEL